MENSAEQWKIANIHSKRQLDRVTVAYVLIRYGFSPSIIRCTTQLHQKTVSRIKEHFVSCGGSDSFQKSGHKIAPNVILRDPKTYYAYNELMVLYAHFHSGDPSAFLDTEALLKAWNFYAAHVNGEPDKTGELDINAMWYLCLYLNVLGVLCEEEDGGRILFSHSSHAYYYHSNHSALPVENSGYIQMRSLKEILKNSKNRELQKAS